MSCTQTDPGRVRRARRALLTALAVGAALAGCSRGPAAVEQLAPAEAYARVQRGAALLIDVREQDELREGMAAPALWIAASHAAAADAAFEAFARALPKDKQLIFYCAVGGRAQRVAEQLAARGHRAANAGGYADWAAAGLPTRKPAPSER
jgi:rhodanese-related sulfurtransferase